MARRRAVTRTRRFTTDSPLQPVLQLSLQLRELGSKSWVGVGALRPQGPHARRAALVAVRRKPRALYAGLRGFRRRRPRVPVPPA